MNKLIFADCLDVLRDMHHHYPDGFIDLVYIDPPFNSKRDYNVLFESIDVKDSKAQRQAFADTWSNVSYIDTLKLIQKLDLDLYTLLKTLDELRLSKGAVSYLTTMAIRLHFIHKVLKDTGSFYLHCDPTMSHYLKLICDLIFGEKNFRNEIIWNYSGWNAKLDTSFISRHDIILFYGKSEKQKFNSYAEPWASIEEYVKVRKQKVRTDDDEKPYVLSDAGGGKRVKRYLDEAMSYGKPVDDVWFIDKVNNSSKEKLGYPTQKPLALLERIIQASSDEGDLVADFFCGCGTTIAAAQKLGRNWIGVDISHLAIKLIIDRLTAPYKAPRAKVIRENIQILGFPRDIAGAKMLARESDNGRFGFQDWIIEVMLGGMSNPKKTADGGFDGYITFEKGEDTNGLSLIEVKSGHVNVKNVREFIQVVEGKKADHGVFVCFAEEVTKPMLLEAKHHGSFQHEAYPNRYDKIQILTVEEILDGNDIDLPMEFFKKNVFKSATKKLTPEAKAHSLFD